MSAKAYNADDYVFLLAGQPVNSGRGPDVFIEIVQKEDSVTHQAGIDGEDVFSFNKNRAATITLTLMQTSSGNALLSELLEASDAAGGILYPCAGQDSRGTSKIASEACAITKFPDEAFGKEAGTTKWVIVAGSAKRKVGSR